MKDKHDQALREHLVYLLQGGGAHADFDTAVKGIAPSLRGKKPRGLEHSAWGLLEHLRLAQWDILEFTRNADYVSPKFPEGYWPATTSPRNVLAWQTSVRAFRADLKAMIALVRDPAMDLFARIPHGSGQTLLREALLVADHNAYHLGQLVQLRKLLGAWKA